MIDRIEKTVNGGIHRMHDYKSVTKKYLAAYSDSLRSNRHLTQERMAEMLRISSRAYGDLERGKYCFSCTALLFMLNMLEHEEMESLLDGFQEQIKQIENGGKDDGKHS